MPDASPLAGARRLRAVERQGARALVARADGELARVEARVVVAADELARRAALLTAAVAQAPGPATAGALALRARHVARLRRAVTAATRDLADARARAVLVAAEATERRHTLARAHADEEVVRRAEERRAIAARQLRERRED